MELLVDHFSVLYPALITFNFPPNQSRNSSIYNDSYFSTGDFTRGLEETAISLWKQQLVAFWEAILGLNTPKWLQKYRSIYKFVNGLHWSCWLWFDALIFKTKRSNVSLVIFSGNRIVKYAGTFWTNDEENLILSYTPLMLGKNSNAL